MGIGNTIVSGLAGGLLALGGISYMQSHAPRETLVGLVGTAVASTGTTPTTPTTAATSSLPAPAPTTGSVARKAELRTTLRRLFEDRMTYTRSSIVSVLTNSSDLAAVTARLMKNQDDVGNALKPYLGAEPAAKLTALLKEQVSLGTAVIKAAKTGDRGKLAAAKKSWSDNGAAVATTLNAANPGWPTTTMTEALQKHLDLTVREVTARLLNDWPADIKAYDDANQQLLGFADTLTDGIARQFPDKFSG
jgi:hypothetical protein